MHAKFLRERHNVLAALQSLHRLPAELVRIPSHSLLCHLQFPFPAQCAFSECLILGVQSREREDPSTQKPPPGQNIYTLAQTTFLQFWKISERQLFPCRLQIPLSAALPGIRFDYRVMALRRKYENVRFARSE